MTTTTTRQQLLATCNDLLQPQRFKDYGPNGLQVEGRENIRHIVSGVTASRALIEAAISAKADAILCTTVCFGAAKTAPSPVG